MSSFRHTPQPVSSYLSASSSVRVQAHVDIGYGRSATIWRNSQDHIVYEAPVGNTFSFYLNGGQGTRRVDGHVRQGWPGAVCVMPEGCPSEWHIEDDFEFLHLFVPEEELRRLYGDVFDRDARLLQLAERTYVEAAELASAFSALAVAVKAGDALSAEAAATALLMDVFVSSRFSEAGRVRFTGGLAPGIRRQLLDYIDAQLDQKIRLRELATIAQLSEYHLQRSFRQSVGVSPQRWITHRRVERAKALIREGVPFRQIAIACGFSSESHLSRTFVAATGVTCGRYRQANRRTN